MRKTSRINPAKRVLFAGAAIIALAGIVPAAQAGHMGNGAQQRNMVTVNRCVAMPHDQMMKDQACKSMMTLHPELFPAGTVPPQNPPR
jgi:hypothetical protein